MSFACLVLRKTWRTFKFSDEQKEKLLKFGDSALLITDRNEFLRKVAVALDREGIKGYHGYVDYYDESKDSLEYWTSLIKNGLNHVAFWKRERYSYQQEYRFLIEPPITENDYYELEIGNISDISVLLTAEQALTAIVSKKKNL